MPAVCRSAERLAWLDRCGRQLIRLTSPKGHSDAKDIGARDEDKGYGVIGGRGGGVGWRGGGWAGPGWRGGWAGSGWRRGWRGWGPGVALGAAAVGAGVGYGYYGYGYPGYYAGYSGCWRQVWWRGAWRLVNVC